MSHVDCDKSGSFKNNVTVCFRILPKKIGHLYVGQLDRPFASIKVTKDIKHLNNKIIECTMENNQWVFMRERVDKSYPNSYTTAMGKLTS